MHSRHFRYQRQICSWSMRDISVLKFDFSRTVIPFDYPDVATDRKHGPAGYNDYQAYKPWLRDEFKFRCVYCLVRERWFPSGAASFGVDHFIPKSKASHLRNNYD